GRAGLDDFYLAGIDQPLELPLEAPCIPHKFVRIQFEGNDDSGLVIKRGAGEDESQAQRRLARTGRAFHEDIVVSAYSPQKNFIQSCNPCSYQVTAHFSSG